jgi:hypothetical protein
MEASTLEPEHGLHLPQTCLVRRIEPAADLAAVDDDVLAIDEAVEVGG